MSELAERDSAVGPWWLNGGEIESLHLFSTQYPGHLLLIRDQVIGREHMSVGINSCRLELFCCMFSSQRSY